MSGAWPSAAAEAIAEAFDLGSAVGGLRPVARGRFHQVWWLRTTTGSWAVKQFNRSHEPWWLAAFQVAAEVETVAFGHGVVMPRPIAAPSAAGRLLADVIVDGVVSSVVVHEWCPGAPLRDVDLTPEVLRWVGETLATLHSMQAVPEADRVVRLELHEVEEWQDWLGQAPSEISADYIRRIRAFIPDVARANEFVDDANQDVGERTAVLTHRDLKPDNVLLTSASPVLVDWEGAGPDFAEWEVARTAVAFGRSPNGWSRQSFEQVIQAYRAATGKDIAPVQASFAGLLQRQLGASANLLWRALGHRPVTAPERAVARDHTLDMLGDLRASLSQISLWTRWLEDLPAGRARH
jgi:Ser/Thr protein kinase RdoA (MazF antagonist)